MDHAHAGCEPGVSACIAGKCRHALVMVSVTSAAHRERAVRRSRSLAATTSLPGGGAFVGLRTLPIAGCHVRIASSANLPLPGRPARPSDSDTDAGLEIMLRALELMCGMPLPRQPLDVRRLDAAPDDDSIGPPVSYHRRDAGSRRGLAEFDTENRRAYADDVTRCAWPT
jgi:hypothetical protein